MSAPTPNVSDVIFRRGRKVRHMLRDMLALTLFTAAITVTTDDLIGWMVDATKRPRS